MGISYKQDTQSVDASGNIFTEPIFDLTETSEIVKSITLSSLLQQQAALQAQLDKINTQIDLVNNQPEMIASKQAQVKP
jgi:hypothetical protein